MTGPGLFSGINVPIPQPRRSNEMTTIFAQISMSLDGYTAGPNDGPEHPLGENGESLHEWIVKLDSWRRQHGLEGGEENPASALVEEYVTGVGATILGRRMFDLGEPHWGQTPPYHTPVFVVTHRPRPPLPREGGTTYHFVTDGITSALEQARAAAGEKKISVAGGANVINQFIDAGLLDELHLHIVPILLGGGARMFDGLPPTLHGFERTRLVESPGATHVTYRLSRPADRA
jgi:dihydrofolate reductase